MAQQQAKWITSIWERGEYSRRVRRVGRGVVFETLHENFLLYSMTCLSELDLKIGQQDDRIKALFSCYSDVIVATQEKYVAANIDAYIAHHIDIALIH
jgi:hypothetical protein